MREKSGLPASASREHLAHLFTMLPNAGWDGASAAAVEALLASVHGMIPELTIVVLEEGRSQTGRAKGSFNSKLHRILLDPEQADEHTLAHELGHALLHKTGWPRLKVLPGLPVAVEDMVAEAYEDIQNKLQEVAMEDILMRHGFDTGPGRAKRAQEDLRLVQKAVEGGADPEGPKEIFKASVVLADHLLCTPEEAREPLSEFLRVEIPKAHLLGHLLASFTRERPLKGSWGVLEAYAGWMALIDSFTPQDALKLLPHLGIDC